MIPNYPIQLYIRDIPAQISALRQANFTVFSQVFLSLFHEIPGYLIILVHYHFLPYCFSFIIHWGSYYFTLYTSKRSNKASLYN